MFNKNRLEKGIYFDRSLKLVEGCSPCGLRCWSAADTYLRSHQKNPKISEPKKGLVNIVNGVPTFNGEIRLRPENLDLPLGTKKPQSWLILNDFFHENVPTRFIDQVLEVMAACPQHIFLALTKRAHNLQNKLYGVTEDNPLRELGGGDYLPNLWLGVTVCALDELWKMGVLRDIPAAVHWVSFEPMLGDLGKLNLHHIEGVVLGGETGPGRRPAEIYDMAITVNQCHAAKVPVFVKQVEIKGKTSKQPSEWPEALRRRELPGIK